MSLMRCEIHDVFWDSDKLEACVLCDWIIHVDPIQSPTDHPASDPPTCASEQAQS